MTSRGGVPGGVGRDRFRRDFTSSRFESSNSNSKRGNNPPSRHLWVGNLSHSIVETDLTDELLQFGDLDSVAFQPGRSYAFVNYNKEEDAIAAIKSLQGFPLAGNPLRIEFAKAVSFCHFCSLSFSLIKFRFPGILLCFCISAKWVVFHALIKKTKLLHLISFHHPTKLSLN
ncbi:hypothetical protein OIU84_016845 [Salix udensis]|uniref:RRM domain-containing protein n=1 Tax=Salix udensis TaxID=889485 RepID=A0AAD6JAZ4_9ROSI|nr:hypothetical protein OIU84_016845 [Salix udensis]